MNYPATFFVVKFKKKNAIIIDFSYEECYTVIHLTFIIMDITLLPFP